MQKTKKLLSILLSITLLLSTIAGMNITAFAAPTTGECGESARFSFSTETGALYITGSGSVTTYGYNEPDQIVSVVIGDSISEIGDFAFMDLKNLTSVTIGTGVKKIGNSAFSRSGLLAVVIPENVTTIDAFVFKDCKSLARATVNGGTTLNSTFDGCTQLSSVTLAEGIKTIEGYTFGDCVSLTSITIPDSVTGISSHTFFGCTALQTVKFGTGADIPDNIFSDFSNLKNVTIPNGVKNIGRGAFSGSGLTHISIPSSVENIYIAAFEECASLTSATIRGITNVGERAFSDCNKLTSVNLNEGVKTIESYAFGDCVSLRTVTIPDSVTSLSAYAFSGCSSLATIKLGSGVTDIDVFYFGDYPSLKNVYIFNKNAKISNENAVSDDVILYCFDNSSAYKYAIRNSKNYVVICKDRTTEHTFETETFAPTCASRGYTKNTCSVCGYYKYTDYIDELPHTPGEAVKENEVPATCREKGSYDSVIYCTVCNEEISREEVIVDELPHTPVEVPEVPATCTEYGEEAYVKCSVCGLILEGYGSSTPPLGHDYEWSRVEPTCTENGYDLYKCTRCGDEYKENETDPIGHDYEYIREATCTKGGYSYDRCKNCGDIQNREYENAFGHSWRDDGITKTTATTYTKDYTCWHCLKTKTVTYNKKANTLAVKGKTKTV